MGTLVEGHGSYTTPRDTIARLNDKSGAAFSFPMSGQDWIRHPSRGNVDVALCRFRPPKPIDAQTIPEEMLLRPEQMEESGIGVGDEVYAVGLFHFVSGKQSNSPIVRHGNVAMIPSDPVKTKDYGSVEAYLIEARSIGGLSGSPVFVRETLNFPVKSSNPSLPEKNIQSLGNTYLLGVAHGHWDIDGGDLNNPVPTIRDAERGGVNIGIAIVTPAHKILETLYRPELIAQRQGLPVPDNG